MSIVFIRKKYRPFKKRLVNKPDPYIVIPNRGIFVVVDKFD